MRDTGDFEGVTFARFDSLSPTGENRCTRFRELLSWHVAWSVDDVLPALVAIDQATRAGRHAAGFIAYEAAPAMDRALHAHPAPAGLPLLAFGIFAQRDDLVAQPPPPPDPSEYVIGELRPSLHPREYHHHVHRILDYIARGDTYQVNYTLHLDGSFAGSDSALYQDLCRAQQADFCAHLRVGRFAIVSASPELFFHLEGRAIRMRPMKGTRPRGRWSAEDESLAHALRTSPKERAENLMIVDLLRNDLGRIARYGSVQVPSAFVIERYPTVLQMTSTIEARLRDEVGLTEIFRALFPSGSVTGAPKIRTSEIIQELEPDARGPYTGAIGFVSPGEAVFSVAIRTAVIDREAGLLRLGVGSGITADSDAGAEYEECLAKGAFLRFRLPDFDLLESLRLEIPGGYARMEGHLERMATSADYFGYRFDASAAREALLRAHGELPRGTYKVRLMSNARGEVKVEWAPIPERMPTVRVCLATVPVSSADRFLYHKTTHRAVYENAARGAPGCDDVLLVNERGELTESATANVVLEIEGELVTPPVESGLLPGVYRAQLLREGRLTERALTPEDLRRASAVYLINSVRGWRRAELV